MVCQRGFSATTARALCSSLGHTQASFVRNMTLDSNESCEFQHDNEIVDIPCRFIFNSLSCTRNTTANGLLQCTFASEISSLCKSNSHIGLTCYTPTTTSRRTSTKRQPTTPTSSSSTTTVTIGAEETIVLVEDKHTIIAMEEDSTTVATNEDIKPLLTTENPATFSMIDERTTEIRILSPIAIKDDTFNSEIE
ncbi:unnamed protein product [Rotaria sp. Silwood2]|nr:unnamed protein product [Rotaria sp. Silwood2]CAF4822198.1 unnamed protein product [Rotaria sp. Silwood2]